MVWSEYADKGISIEHTFAFFLFKWCLNTALHNLNLFRSKPSSCVEDPETLLLSINL